MRIVEIFDSIEGEGKRVGKLATFIRLAGCNLNCTYCDTRYARSKEDGVPLGIDVILSRVNFRRVTLTGGEPLMRMESELLIRSLLKNGHSVNIETNGSIDLSKFMLLRDEISSTKDLFFTMDFKLPSSGSMPWMHYPNIQLLGENDVLKFVVGNESDLTVILEVIRRYPTSAQIYISPVFGFEPANIVNFMKVNKLHNCTLQVQLHKVIYPVEMRGV